jgi:hypothetical protein
MDPFGRISIHAVDYRVDYDEKRAFFRWQKVPGQAEGLSP